MQDHDSQLPEDEGGNPNPSPPPVIPEDGVEVPYELINPSTLDELIKAFVLREGTDYGSIEASLERKVESVRRQLQKGELKLVFDLANDSGSIVSVR